jgi:hypothetical protein
MPWHQLLECGINNLRAATRPPRFSVELPDCSSSTKLAICRSSGWEQTCSFNSCHHDQQTTKSDDRLIKRIEVTAPTHALCGQTLQVVRKTKRNGEPAFVVLLENGDRQAVLVPDTAAAAPPALSDPSLLFSSGCLRALTPLVASLRAQQEPEACHERSLSDQSLEHIRQGRAPAACLAARRPASAPDPRSPGASRRRSPR